MRIALLIMVVYLTYSSLSVPQSSFSPFSLLGSFFGSHPLPTRPRQRPSLPRQRPRKRGQQGPRIIVHPGLKVGPSISTPNFSASQPAPVRIKLEENPTVPPKKLTHSQPRKSSQRLTDSKSFIGSVNVSSENSTSPELKVTRKFIFNRTSDIRSNLDTTDTSNQVIENISIYITKNENSSHIESDRNKNDEVKRENIIEPTIPTTKTVLNEPNNNTLVSFFIPSEKIESDHYDELLPPVGTHYAPQIFQYNTGPFILEETVRKSFSENNIYENNLTKNQDIRFQIYPRGNVGSQRNQPTIISQIPVNSPQISNKLVENSTPPFPQRTFSPLSTIPTTPPISPHYPRKKIPTSPPISPHYPRKKKHTILTKQLVKSLRDDVTENSFFHDTAVQQFKDETTLKPLTKPFKEDMSIIKEEERQSDFSAEVLPTPQKQHQFESAKIAENVTTNIEHQISDYTQDEYTKQDSIRGSNSRNRQYYGEGHENRSAALYN